MTLDHAHDRDIFVNADGTEEYGDPWVIEGNEQLNGQHSGSICVHDGAMFTIATGSHHSGSLACCPGSVGRIIGKNSGSLHVAPTAVVEVTGDQSGSVHVERGALVRVAPGGKLAGSLHVAGEIENRGMRGGTLHLEGGQVQDVDGGTVKQPTHKDGISVYEW